MISFFNHHQTVCCWHFADLNITQDIATYEPSACKWPRSPCLSVGILLTWTLRRILPHMNPVHVNGLTLHAFSVAQWISTHQVFGRSWVRFPWETQIVFFFPTLVLWWLLHRSYNYCAFQKGVPSAQVNRYYEVHFSLLSIIIMATANGPETKPETNNMNWNLPITTDRCDLLTLLKQIAIPWEVRLDDWRQQKTYSVVTVDLRRGSMFLKSTIIIIKAFFFHSAQILVLKVTWDGEFRQN